MRIKKWGESLFELQREGSPHILFRERELEAKRLYLIRLQSNCTMGKDFSVARR